MSSQKGRFEGSSCNRSIRKSSLLVEIILDHSCSQCVMRAIRCHTLEFCARVLAPNCNRLEGGRGDQRGGSGRVGVSHDIEARHHEAT